MVKRLSGVLAALLLVVSACGEETGDSAAAGGNDSGASSRSHAPQPVNPDGAACTYADAQAAVKPVEPPAATAAYDGTVEATVATNRGDIDVVLDAASAPCTVNSFTSLASQGYFDNTPCHRLTTEGIYVLQCGDPLGLGTGGPGYAFADELSGSETYEAGTLAMANAGPGTNGSQFFLVYEDTTLPAAYTVFGTIDPDGLEVLASIADAGTADGGGDGAPAEAVDIDFLEIGDSTPGDPAQPTSPATEATCTYNADGSGSAKVPASEPSETEQAAATITTSQGKIPLMLEAAGAGGPGYSFADELEGTETYEKGTLARANAGPNTNGSQFFLVYEDTTLPAAYTVFGSIAPAGLKVLAKIARAGVKGGAGDGAPKKTVRITSVTLS